MNYKLTKGLREELKKPFGELLQKPDWEEEFVTVGDQCSFLATQSGKQPLLMVYDNLIKRQETCDEKKEAIEKMPGKKIVVDNPAGIITNEALMAIRLSFESKPTKIEVCGEEDLLVLPCIQYAPNGTIVYYGQPDKGVVKVIVNNDSKEKAKKIMLSMKEV